MAVVMRPYHETVPSDLQAAYDAGDRIVMAEFGKAAAMLRDLSTRQFHLNVRHDFSDPNRYDTLKRTAMQLASDLERAIANSGLAK